jgi:hypothetical protein
VKIEKYNNNLYYGITNLKKKSRRGDRAHCLEPIPHGSKVFESLREELTKLKRINQLYEFCGLVKFLKNKHFKYEVRKHQKGI